MKTSKRTGGAPVRYVLSLAIAGAFLAPNARALTTDPAVAPADPTQPAPARKSSPGVQEILKMIQAKVDPEIIKTYVKNSPTAYSLMADEIIDLQKQGVPDEVVTAMIQHGAELRARAPQALPSPTVPPATGVPATQYAPTPAPYAYPSSPGYTGDYGDYGTPYYDFSTPYYAGYAGYPWYYSYSYPYYNYWWWSSYGYPWFGYYPYYYGYNRYHHGYGHYGDHGYGHYGGYRGGYGHNGGYYSHNQYRGNGSYRGGYGAPNRNQAWRPVGNYASRPSSFSGRSPYSPARSFAARPAGGFGSRPASFASRSGGFGGRPMGGGAVRSGGGFGGRPMGGGGAVHSGGGGGGRAMGGGRR